MYMYVLLFLALVANSNRFQTLGRYTLLLRLLFLCTLAFMFSLSLSRRKLNTLSLSRHTQLLEVLEIPQVVETCVRNGYYEEALDLSAHVRRMDKKHGSIPIIKVSSG